MHFKNTSERFGSIAKLFHWAIALFVIIQYLLILFRDYILPEQDPLGLVLLRDWHKPLGVLILALAILRLVWRWFNIQPSYPPKLPLWEKGVAHLVHFLLYICLFVAPISGILMSQAAGYPVKFFNFFSLPILIEKNKALANFFHDLHEYSTYAFLALFVLHVLGALKHHYINRNQVLVRMMP